MSAALPVPDLLRPLSPVEVRPLLSPLHAELIALLESLAPSDWEQPTVAGAWRVRHVAAHLLDGALRRLSLHRDGHAMALPAEALASEAGLVAFLNGLNAQWVEAAERLSPAVLLHLLREAGRQEAEFLASLDPEGEAHFSVAWAGEAVSRNWMDVGREYTELWHHQQQIRLAIERPLLLEPSWLRPLLELSLRALPHRYRDVPAAEGDRLAVDIRGEAGGRYALVRQGGGWSLFEGPSLEPTARIGLDEDAAWRVFFKAWRAGAPPAVACTGSPALTEPFLRAWAVMA